MLRRMLMLTAFLAALPVLAGPREDFDRLVREVQAAPQDAALRERVIAAAQALKPPPALPEGAERHLARGEAAIERAKAAADFEIAVREFEQASRAAPWHAAAYFNLAVAQEKAGKPKDAIGSFKRYLLAAPGASDAAAVRKRLYKLEFDAEQAAQAPSPPASAARSLAGTWVLRQDLVAVQDSYFRAEVDGSDTLRLSYTHHVTVANPHNVSTQSRYRQVGLRLKLQGNEVYGNFDIRTTNDCLMPPESGRLAGHLSNDRRRLELDLTRPFNDLISDCARQSGTRTDRWTFRKID